MKFLGLFALLVSMAVSPAYAWTTESIVTK